MTTITTGHMMPSVVYHQYHTDKKWTGLTSPFLMIIFYFLAVLKKGNLQPTTMDTANEEDFDHLFDDMDLNSTKLGNTPEARNSIIAKLLSHPDKTDFKLEPTEPDVLA